MEKRKIVGKVARIIGNVLLYMFIVIAVLGVILTITGKKDADGATTIFGKQMRIVQSPSMEKCDDTDVSGYEIKDIPTKSMIFIEVVPEDKNEAEKWYADVKVGDVLTFKYVYVRQETITHRVTKIEAKETGGYIFHLEGDNKAEDSETLTQTIDTSLDNSPNYVVGKVTGKSYFLGLLVSTLKAPAGIVCVIILPSLIIIVLEILKIVRMFHKERKKKDEQVKEEQQNEIEELKRKLAQLEANQTPQAENTQAESTKE